jgi:quercetin dioxygenase-like cupin family protein
MPETTIYRWSELPEESAFGVIKRAVYGKGASVKQVEVPAGASGERHSHDHEQFVLVLEGSGTLQCNCGPVDLKPGTVIHFEKDAWHSTVFDTKTLLLEVNLAN